MRVSKRRWEKLSSSLRKLLMSSSSFFQLAESPPANAPPVTIWSDKSEDTEQLICAARHDKTRLQKTSGPSVLRRSKGTRWQSTPLCPRSARLDGNLRLRPPLAAPALWGSDFRFDLAAISSLPGLSHKQSAWTVDREEHRHGGHMANHR